MLLLERSCLLRGTAGPGKCSAEEEILRQFQYLRKVGLGHAYYWNRPAIFKPSNCSGFHRSLFYRSFSIWSIA